MHRGDCFVCARPSEEVSVNEVIQDIETNPNIETNPPEEVMPKSQVSDIKTTICKECNYIFGETFGRHSETKCSKSHKSNKFVRTQALLSKSDAEWPDEFIASSLKVKFLESKESVKWAGHRSCPKVVLKPRKRLAHKAMALIKVPLKSEIFFNDTEFQIDDIIALDEKLRSD